MNAAGRAWAADLLRAATTTAAALAALGTVLALGRLVSLPAQVPVLAVVLTITLGRLQPRGARLSLETVLELPLLALAAGATGWLVVHEPWVGQPLLVVGLSAGILARRSGPAVRRAGRLVSLPFLALLVTPVPVAAPTGHAWRTVVEGAGAALVAAAWTTVAGILAGPLARRVAAPSPVPDTAPARPGGRRRIDAPTRMAAQMATGLAAAFVVGHLLFGDRWVWTVLSAFLVASGNRGRGDVVHKAVLRVLGAGAGTVAATLLAAAVAPGDRRALVVLFAVLGVALVLRQRSYAFWAAGVTAMVALLHGYYGSRTGAGVLGERLLGILAGSGAGVAAAWFVLPVRTRDVLRRRIADCLAALSDDLALDPADAAAAGGNRFPGTLARLDELTPTLRAHSRAARRPRGAGAPHPVQALAALRELTVLPSDPGERRRLRAATARVRRAMVGRDDPDPEELPGPLATVHRVLAATAPRPPAGAPAQAPGGNER